MTCNTWSAILRRQTFFLASMCSMAHKEMEESFSQLYLFQSSKEQIPEFQFDFLWHSLGKLLTLFLYIQWPVVSETCLITSNKSEHPLFCLSKTSEHYWNALKPETWLLGCIQNTERRKQPVPSLGLPRHSAPLRNRATDAVPKPHAPTVSVN